MNMCYLPFSIGTYDCTVNSDVGTDDFSIILGGFGLEWTRVRAIARLRTWNENEVYEIQNQIGEKVKCYLPKTKLETIILYNGLPVFRKTMIKVLYN